MGRRPSISGDEADLNVRHLYCYLQKAGKCRRIKTRVVRRERHAAKAAIRRGDDA